MKPSEAITVDDWTGCYSRQWSDILTPGAVAHPAKFAPGLVERIYRHLAEDLHLPAGSTVLDPFGGVCCGAYAAGAYGYPWIGVELEPRFVALGRANLERWKGRLFGGEARATLLQGDSRRLRDVLAGAEVGACVSSPPYTGRSGAGPTVEYGGRKSRGTPGQLGEMQTGTPPTALVSSPPYVDQKPQGGPDAEEQRRMKREGRRTDLGRDLRPDAGYGATPGQLGAVVSSPPYEGSAESGNRHGANGVMARIAREKGPNLGGAKGETFWSGAKAILAELAAILPPGAPAVWVVKAFVRDGKIVPFPEDWERLCNAAGFRTLHRHRALLGNRKSFFRRVHEARGAPRIDWETVVCTVRE